MLRRPIIPAFIGLLSRAKLWGFGYENQTTLFPISFSAACYITLATHTTLTNVVYPVSVANTEKTGFTIVATEQNNASFYLAIGA